MRPTLGADVPEPSSRKPTATDRRSSLPSPGHGVPTTFFLRKESEMEQSKSRPESRQQDSAYGVQSLEDAIGAAFGEHSGDEVETDKRTRVSRKRKAGKALLTSAATLNTQQSSPTSTQTSSPSRPHNRRLSQASTSQPLTPLYLESPAPNSAYASTPRSGSIKSLRLSDEEESVLDDAASQAIASSEEEEDLAGTEKVMDLQLVMPSINMPSRRPFTEKGKRMGRLKVLIAGDTSTGKTSLINAIVRICEDIVHVDPLPSDSSTGSALSDGPIKGKQSSKDLSPTVTVTEINASTRAYPSWWSDLEDSRVLRRRRSLGETVLERNLRFVDTPGYLSPWSTQDLQAANYIESQLHHNASLASIPDADLLGILSGQGGTQVDVVFYVFPPDTEAVIDVNYFSRLSSLTNVIPLIGKSDLLSPAQLTELKSRILQQLKAFDVRPFLFGKSVDEALNSLDNSPPYAVSSALSNDTDNMDASLLMSPDYVQPLVSSELEALVAQVFEPENIAWLRHAAVKKFLQWRTAALGAFTKFIQLPPTPLPPRMGNPIVSSSAAASMLSSPSGILVPRPQNDGHFLLPSLSQIARLSDNYQREESQAQLHLAKWASDLQRSLRNERERYKDLAQAERAVWLLERAGECLEDAKIVPAAPSPSADKGGMVTVSWPSSNAPTGGHKRRIGRGVGMRMRRMDRRDPLGILQWEGDLRRKLLVVAKVAGGFGVLGVLAVWAARRWGFWGMGMGMGEAEGIGSGLGSEMEMGSWDWGRDVGWWRGLRP